MGRSTTPRYVLSVVTTRFGSSHSRMEWRIGSRNGIRGYGNPTMKNIDRWVTEFERSMVAGPNKHLGVYSVISAKIVNQFTGETVADWERTRDRPDEPKFQVVT